MYGCRYLELLTKARLYYEVKRFSKNEYAPILERELEWKTERAFLAFYAYELLQKLVDQGTLYLGSETIKAMTLSDEISSIVDKLVACRCYADALELNERVKMLY